MERSGRPPSIWEKSCLTPHSWNFRVDCSKLVGFCSSCLYATDLRCLPHVYGHRCVYVHATSAEQSSLGCFLHSHWPMTTNPCSRRVDRLVRDNRRRLKRIAHNKLKGPTWLKPHYLLRACFLPNVLSQTAEGLAVSSTNTASYVRIQTGTTGGEVRRTEGTLDGSLNPSGRWWAWADSGRSHAVPAIVAIARLVVWTVSRVALRSLS